MLTPLLLTAFLSGCATQAINSKTITNTVTPPAQWQAPLPHGGSVTALTLWWQSLGDPVLMELLDAAQKVSPTIASAKSRIVQARATLTGAQSAYAPQLSTSLIAQRGVNSSFPTASTAFQGSLDASWEIDVFGGNRQSASAALARLDGANAAWHDARVSVAAEVSTRYFNFRTCEQLAGVLQSDTQSRRETARLTDLTAKAGFAAPATAALANASAAESNARTLLQQAQCASDVKALVALTAIEEPQLRNLLKAPIQGNSQAAMPLVTVLPAALLTQRPDVYVAERDVAAASGDLGATQAQRYPRLTVGGSVGALNFSNSAGTIDLSTWSIGPVSLSLPLFDAGKRAANVDAAVARYDESAAIYRGKVRQAVREVEDALLTLYSTEARQADAAAALNGYAASFEATRARFATGSASLPELEEARRNQLSAQSTLLQLELQRITAWINLYRALGGGWTGPYSNRQAAQ
jgi:NodT family efflux transporter outer membrane factor (OMF) lipoprotein